MRARARGFTLMEVMVALVLLVGGVLAVSGVFNGGLLASGDREDVQRALAIAQARLEQVMNTDPDSLAGSGPAADSVFTAYTVTTTVTGSNPKQAAVTVAWTPQGGQTSITLTTLVADLD